MSYRGVCFAAGFGLWGRRWRLSGRNTGAIAAPSLGLVQFDQVLGLTPSAVERLVDMLCRSGLDAGDGEADVEGLGGGLDPGAGTAIGVPRFRLVARLGEAAKTGLLIEPAAGANVIGSLVNRAVEQGVAGQAEDEVDGVLVAPFHDFRTAVMAVTPDGDPGLRPVPADATDKTAQVTAHLASEGAMATRQEWLDWVKAKRQAQAEMREQISAMENGLRIGSNGHDITAMEISLLKQQIAGVERVVQDAIKSEGLPPDA
jgi:hypothetical protein